MQEEQERSEGNHLAHSGTGSLLSSQASPLSSKAHLSHLAALAWGHRREAREIRRGRWEGPCGKSRRGAKGDCPTHSGPGRLLSSQANPLPSKTPSRLRGSLGEKEGGQGDQERQVGGTLWDRRSRREEEGICPAHSSPGSLLGSQVRLPAL